MNIKNGIFLRGNFMTDYMAKSHRTVLYYKHNNVIHGKFGKE